MCDTAFGGVDSISDDEQLAETGCLYSQIECITFRTVRLSIQIVLEPKINVSLVMRERYFPI